jgi:broad-specificity NMP kinase
VFNVCPNCGEYRVDKSVMPEGPYAVCPVCEYQHRFVRLPLFVVTGASGTGKTTTCLTAATSTKDFVVMESDILYSNELKTETDHQRYRELWLRVCKNISQAGKPVILCGSCIPSQYESCVERRYFSEIHYLALVCDDETLAARLRSRPAWRRTSDDEYIARHVEFNRWLKNNARTTEPPMALLDTTEISVDESVEQLLLWALKI